MLSFPCYEVNARFDHGMERRNRCRRVGCTVWSYLLLSPCRQSRRYAVSHVTTLWPMLRTLISADRDGDYPKGVTYHTIDLALDGLIGVTDLAQLDLRDFPGRALP